MADIFKRNLTIRELEILSLIATGASAKEIARDLRIAVRTVEAHINHLKLKTSAKNRAHLVAVALQLGLIANPCDDEGAEIADEFIATVEGPNLPEAPTTPWENMPHPIHPMDNDG